MAKKKNSAKERNATPKIKCPHIADMRRPHTTESSGKLATKVAEFHVAEESWTKSVRQAFVEGKKAAGLPGFPASKFVNPNTGQMSRSAHDAAIDLYNDAVEAGTKTPPMFPRYNPVLIDLIHLQNCQSLRRGSIQKHSNPPKDWDQKLYGPWLHEWKEDGETVTEKSGWFFDEELPRRCHAERAELLIDDPEKDILTFGSLRVVVGTGTHDGSAVFKVHQTSHGNYRIGDITRKRMSFAGIKEVRNIVFKIEDKPNNAGGFTVKGNWADVREMVYMPGQVLTAGYLYDSKGVLDAKAIRALDADTKGLRFKALEAPIVGKLVSWNDLWTEMKVDKAGLKTMRDRVGRSEEYETGSVETRANTNLRVNGLRVDPSEAHPFGLRGSQCHMVAYIEATGEGKIEDGHFSMGVAIGARANFEYNVGVHAAKGETAEPKAAKAPRAAKAPKAPKVAKAPKAVETSKVAKPKKPKAEKVEVSEAEKKAKAARASIAAKVSPDRYQQAGDLSVGAEAVARLDAEEAKSDAAPPVEANTADESSPKVGVEGEVVTAAE